MSARTAAAAGIAAALAACGGPDSGDEAAPQPPDQAAAPPADAPASEAPPQRDPARPDLPAATPGQDGMAWHFSRTSRGPKLVYGERRTDNVRLMLRCPPGGESVMLSFIRPADLVRRRPGELEIRSGGAARILALDSQESQLGGRIVEAVAPIGVEPLQRFRGGSALEVRWGEETISLPAGGAHQHRIRQFFETCGPTG